jgi:hypothetical protein
MLDFFQQVPFSMLKRTHSIINKTAKGLYISFIDILPASFSVASFDNAKNVIILWRDQWNVHARAMPLAKILRLLGTKPLLFPWRDCDFTGPHHIR